MAPFRDVSRKAVLRMENDLFAIGLPDLIKNKLLKLTGLEIDFKDDESLFPARCKSAGPFVYRGQMFEIGVFEDTVTIEWCKKRDHAVCEVYRGHGPEAVAQECLELIETIFECPAKTNQV